MLRSAMLLLAALCVLAPEVARAEDDLFKGALDWFSRLGKPVPPPNPPPEDLGARNTFTLNPFAIGHDQLGVEYEHAFGTGFSLYVAPEFTYGSAATSWQLAVGGTLGTRIFVLGNAPSGIFFGPQVTTLYLRTYRDGVLTHSLGLGFGGSVGWTLVLFNRFTASAGFSAEYRSVPDPSSPEPGATRVELNPVPRLAFGVAF